MSSRLAFRRSHHTGLSWQITLVSCVLAVVLQAPDAMAQTLSQALTYAYANNPKLQAERARLRATDEEVAKALSGYRPSIVAMGDTGYDSNRFNPASGYAGKVNPRGYRVQLQQMILDPKTSATVSSAEARVISAREGLRATEGQLILDAVVAYNTLIRDNATVQLQRSYVDVLNKELLSTRRQFEIGEKTLTDVAQAENRLAGAKSQYDTSLVSQRASEANFRKVFGTDPGTLQPPPLPTDALPTSLSDALGAAQRRNPSLVAAVYQERAARSDIDVVRSEFLPTIKLEAQARSRTDENTFVTDHSETTITGTLVVPIYSGGDEHARLRASKQTQIGRLRDIDQTRAEVESTVIAAWTKYQGALARRANDEVQMRAAQTALRGVQEEERSGLRTSLDVLNAQQELLNARVNSESTRAEISNAAYAVVAVIGRLDPEAVGAGTSYDPTAYYKAVRNKWAGDVPTNQLSTTPVQRSPTTRLGTPPWSTSIVTAATAAPPTDRRSEGFPIPAPAPAWRTKVNPTP